VLSDWKVLLVALPGDGEYMGFGRLFTIHKTLGAGRLLHKAGMLAEYRWIKHQTDSLFYGNLVWNAKGLFRILAPLSASESCSP
jgi:hypothetical protein